MRTTAYPQLDEHVTIKWENDGTYTPICELCSYKGKRRAIHAEAVAAYRAHQGSARHRRARAKLAVGR